MYAFNFYTQLLPMTHFAETEKNRGLNADLPEGCETLSIKIYRKISEWFQKINSFNDYKYENMHPFAKFTYVQCLSKFSWQLLHIEVIGSLTS